MQQIRCLYVDDERDICEIAKIALALDPDIDVTCCTSGIEALSVAGTYRPDIVLLDVMMPGMDGVETLANLRATAALQDLPIVFVTARSQPNEIDDFLKAGADDVITKPFDPMALASQVRQYTENRA